MKPIRKRRLLSVILALALLCTLVPVTTAKADTSVSYADNGAGGSVSAYTEVVTSDTTEPVVWNGGWYVVKGADVTIESRVTVSGSVKLILCDGATLTAKKGITVETVKGENNSLTVYAQSGGSGTLFAGTTNGSDQTAAEHAAGIGCSSGVIGGTVTVCGGDITAVGGQGGAGIGGGAYRKGAEVTVYGGSVEATGSGGAGIGGGYLGNGNGTLNPKGEATRAQVAALFVRFARSAA